MSKKMTRREALGSMALVLLGAAGVGAGTYEGVQWYEAKQDAEDTSSPRDLDGNVVALEDGDAPTEEEVREMDVEDEVFSDGGDRRNADGTASSDTDDTASGATSGEKGSGKGGVGGSSKSASGSGSGSADGSGAAQPIRLVVPSVKLDVGVARLSAVNGVVTPPGFRKAYLIRNIGVSLDDTDKGTVYLAMHSVHNGSAPGNRLIDIDSGKPRVANGAEVHIGDQTYVVTGSDSIVKGDLSTNKDVWISQPGRLVMITCLQRSSGKSLRNVVVYAQKK